MSFWDFFVPTLSGYFAPSFPSSNKLLPNAFPNATFHTRKTSQSEAYFENVKRVKHTRSYFGHREADPINAKKTRPHPQSSIHHGDWFVTLQSTQQTGPQVVAQTRKRKPGCPVSRIKDQNWSWTALLQTVCGACLSVPQDLKKTNNKNPLHIRR